MTGLAMLRIVAIVCLSALTIRGEVHGQEEYAAFEDSLYHRLLDYPRPQPSYPQGVQVDAHVGDSLVLVELYDSTQGNFWTISTGWLQTPVSKWYGITLNSEGRVKKVVLESNNLVGPLPKSIGMLAELDSLSLPKNELTGPIPPELGQLKELKYLWLSWNDLSGEIPVELAQMTKMEELHFTENSLTGQIPRELGQLANLKRLWLSDNALSGTIPSELRHLEMIGLNENNLSGPIPTHLAEWENLIELYLCKNGFTGQIPPQLGQLSKLEWLCLGGNQLSGPIPTELSQLTSLKFLRLYGNQLSGSIPQELGQLSRLEELHLYGNQLSGSIPQELGQLSRLRELILSGNQLSGSIPQVLGQLSRLQWLLLDDNQLSGSIPEVLGQLSQLLRLGMAINQLSGTIPTELGQLSQLQWLHLHNNQLSGTIPQELGQLDSLQFVALENNQFLGPVPDWTSLSSLKSVRLYANQFLFADLLPNADWSRIRTFTYAPQDSIDTQQTCTSSECVFTTPARTQGNQYQWYRNGDAMPNEQSQTLRVNVADSPARYHATITNRLLPDLTLVSRKQCVRSEAACQAAQFAHEGDSLALVALYNATGGPDTWIDRSGWLQAPVSEWFGIRLNSSGRVTDIELLDNNLSGELPSDFGQLAALKSLLLRFNGLTGGIPPEMGQLAELTKLHLGGNNLSGRIPPELGSLAKLEELFLPGNDFSGPIPPELGQLDNLRWLFLGFNSLSGSVPVELRNLGELERLSLENNDLSGRIPPELGDLTNLDLLYLHQNDLSAPIPSELGQLAELIFLQLFDNSLSGPIPPELGNLGQLLDLDLSGNALSGSIPTELGQLTELENLSLHLNDLSGPIPPELAELDQLRLLHLNNNNLAGAIPEALGQLTKLRRLWLHENSLSGSVPAELGQLSHLAELELQHNEFSGVIPSELEQLDSLQVVYVHDNQFSGPLPDWTGLDSLKWVRIQANQFLFADLLPNAELSGIPEFTYAPQDTINTQLTCSTSEYVFTTPATADGNQYQWYRNGEAIPGAQSDTLRLSIASDLGEYHASVTNDALPDLTLLSHRVRAGGASGCTTQQYANAADSTLLVDFFNRTHGSLLWHTHTGWLEEPVAQWYGISLDASGRVTHVNLPRNNLVGQLPLSQLDQLPHLRRLDVSGNEFSGTIPKGLGALTQLEYLDLSRNTLAGELPKQLAGQAPLRVLNVGGNQLVGAIPTELSQISTLQTFSVSANQLSGPVPAFTGLDQLDTLHVAQNAFLFMDLIPNASLTRLDEFVYAPQDSIETLLTRTASGFALTTAARAAGNRYQWYRDDQPISGPQSDTLHVSATSDPAQYNVAITNDRLPDLTLVSRKKGVHDGLIQTEAELPQDFLLHQSYPNPFAEATTVAFELATPEHVRIVVYDLLGQVVAKIADGRFAAGVHRIEFAGNHLASGQYLYRMEAGAYRATRSMSVVR